MSRSFLMQPLEPRQLLTGTLTPSFVPVTISQAALTADPSLANFQTFDLKVTTTGADDWLSGDLYIVLKKGSLYLPSGHSNTAQQSLWGSNPKLQFDTFVTAPNFTSPIVLGSSHSGSQTAVFTSTVIDVAWGDIATTAAGTYTVARFTLTKDADGVITGRVGHKEDPQNPITFASTVPRADGGAISGYVWNDLNVSGAKELGESNYLNRAQVYLDANNNGHLDSGEVSARSRTNGNYTFTNVAAGTYRVRINPPAGYRRTAPLPTFSWNVTIIGGAQAGGKRFGITQKVKIAGIVFNDGNANGTKDSAEGGRAGFLLWLDTDSDGLLDAGERSTSSDANGNFVFDNLSAGTYNVTIANKNGFRRTTQGSFSVALSNGQTRTDLAFGEKKIS